MGAANYLRQHFQLDNVKIVGASAGALAGVLMACQIDAETALRSALQICDEFYVRDRWLSFVGIWGDMVKEWLDRLLPCNAADLCQNKVSILVSQFLGTKKIVSTFASKKELIECLMVSTHIPFFMDYYPFRWFQGWWCYDGCIGIFTNRTYKIFGNENYQYYFLSPLDDDQQNYSIFQALPTNIKTDRLTDFIKHGFEYAKRLHETKRLSLPLLNQ